MHKSSPVLLASFFAKRKFFFPTFEYSPQTRTSLNRRRYPSVTDVTLPGRPVVLSRREGALRLRHQQHPCPMSIFLLPTRRHGPVLAQTLILQGCLHLLRFAFLACHPPLRPTLPTPSPLIFWTVLPFRMNPSGFRLKP